MNYVINEDICKKKGMDLPSLLAVLLVKTGVNITELFNDLVNKEVLVKDMFSEGFLVTQRWDSTCSDILLSADTSVPSDERLLPLVDTLMSIFPSGKKEGTSLYWKGNRKDNKERLQKFFKLYGNKYSDEQIIHAAKKYVESFNGQYTYMRALKYFIWKDEKKMGNDGRKYIEEVSDLASYIENAGQEDDLKRDWTSTIN
jgi:hypothetical protein